MVGKKHRRRGAATLETALVIIPLFMLLCGIFEYGRLLLVWNVLNNAAREGCRYALVNNTAGTISTDVQNLINTRLGSQASSFTNLTVSISGTHQGVATTVNNLAAGDFITVSLSGKYKFMNIIPFIPMAPITINSSVTMLCEGGT